MRDKAQWELTDVQRFLVVIAVVGAMFLSAMSLGMGRLPPLFIGLGLVLVAGLGVFLLGLRSNGSGVLDATAYVLWASPPPRAGKIGGRCDMRLLVQIPGRTALDKKVRDPSVHVIRWPRPGMVLPVEVSFRNGARVVVRWDRVAPHGDQASMAEEVAAFAVPFFTDYADGAFGSGPAPRQRGPADDTQPLGDPVPPGGGSASAGPGAPAGADEREPPGGEGAAPTGRDVPAGEDGGTLPRRDARGSSGPRADPPDATRAPDATLQHQRPPGASDATPMGPSSVGAMLMVADLSRSLTFYLGLADFEVLEHTANGAVLKGGAGRLELRQVSDPSLVEQRAVHLRIEVADIAATFAALKSRGVQFLHEPRVVYPGSPARHVLVTVRDPDGHEVALTQWTDTG